uniref:Secreted protein n=1 Tax=Arion vulgaris TaxID=1028688 RepID=A0A0B6ZWV0_9EUPU
MFPTTISRMRFVQHLRAPALSVCRSIVLLQCMVCRASAYNICIPDKHSKVKTHFPERHKLPVFKNNSGACSGRPSATVSPGLERFCKLSPSVPKNL